MDKLVGSYWYYLQAPHAVVLVNGFNPDNLLLGQLLNQPAEGVRIHARESLIEIGLLDGDGTLKNPLARF